MNVCDTQIHVKRVNIGILFKILTEIEACLKGYVEIKTLA